jgi:hypothetical protein
MKYICITCLLITLLFSCEKKHDLCQDGTCDNYLKVWKELFISRNNMTEGYFNEHIFPYNTRLDVYVDGKTFHVEYTIKINWAEAKLWDSFIYWLDPSTSGLYPSLPLPRSTNLSAGQINILVDHLGFGSTIHKIEVIDQLKYASLEDAKKVLNDASGIDQLKDWKVIYKYELPTDGPNRPLLTSRATLNDKENKCMSCTLDLVTGETEVIYVPCRVYLSVAGTKPSE